MLNFNFIGAGTLLVATAAWSLVFATDEQQGHLSNSQCQDCHVAQNVGKENAAFLVASQEKLCASCHANAVRLSHPSGISPQRTLPSDFPLDWKGTLTCSSCHTIHAHEAAHETRFMRSPLRGADFCHACHDQNFFVKMADGGVSMTGSGHLDARKTTSGLPLDPFTLQCLGCHDDQGGDLQVGVSMAGVVSHSGSSVNHPIGVNYERASRGGGYRPAARLPPEILLPDGNVGCVSCHAGYSTRHGKLLIPNDGSGLCLVCHDL